MPVRFLDICALLLCTLLAGSSDGQIPLFTGSKVVALSATRVSVAGIVHASFIRPVAGWILRSDDPDFGGLSALSTSRGGLHALTDSGLLVHIPPRLDRAVLRSLPKACVPFQSKWLRDSESFVEDAKPGTLWIGFEFRNRICRIASWGDAQSYQPPVMSGWRPLSGPETMTRLADGRFVVIAERDPGGGWDSPLLVFDRDPVDPEASVTRLRYRPPVGYRPVDAAMLSDGRMLVLNRRFRFPFSFSAIVTLAEPFDVQEGAVIEGKPVILLASPGIADNFEAISVATRSGETHVWLASDNNFLPEQRTYLLDFLLKDSSSGSGG